MFEFLRELEINLRKVYLEVFFLPLVERVSVSRVSRLEVFILSDEDLVEAEDTFLLEAF